MSRSGGMAANSPAFLNGLECDHRRFDRLAARQIGLTTAAQQFPGVTASRFWASSSSTARRSTLAHRIGSWQTCATRASGNRRVCQHAQVVRPGRIGSGRAARRPPGTPERKGAESGTASRRSRPSRRATARPPRATCRPIAPDDPTNPQRPHGSSWRSQSSEEDLASVMTASLVGVAYAFPALGTPPVAAPIAGPPSSASGSAEY